MKSDLVSRVKRLFSTDANKHVTMLRWLVIGALVLMGMLTTAIIWVIFGKASDTQTTESTSTFPNLLKPTETLRVGTHRYVSPCQVLPLSTASSIFGKTDASTKASEETIDVSVPATSKNDPVRTRCTYRLADSTISLEADQYVDRSKLRRLSATFLVDNEKTEALIDTLKQTASGSRDAKELVGNFERTFSTYKKYEKEYDEAVLAMINTEGLLLPARFGNGTQMIHNNVVYTLDTDQDIEKATASDLAKLNKGLKAITANGRNMKLDQSPVATILGSRDKIGSTKILEPCVILSKSVFKTISGGVDANDFVKRATLPMDSNRDVIDKQVNKRVLFSNSCERNSEGGDVDTRAELQIYQAKTVTYAQQYVKDFDDNPATTPSQLETEADEAYLFPSNLNAESTLYLFRAGPYVCLVTLEKTDSSTADLRFIEFPPDQYIKAINVLVDEIKKYR